MGDDGDKQGGSIWYWLAGGCGVLVILGGIGMCVGPGLVGMLLMDGFGGPGGFGGGPVGAVPQQPTYGNAGGLQLPAPPGPVEPASNAEMTDASLDLQLEITSVTGFDEIAVGDTCPFTVNRIPRNMGGYWCRTSVECNGVLLYGGPGQGYFDCSFEQAPNNATFSAWDYAMTIDDGDPSLNADGFARTVTIADDAGGMHGEFRVEGRFMTVDSAEALPVP